MQHFQTQVADRYNALLGIEEAKRRLDELGGEEMLGRVLSVIGEAGLAESVGIRLLHKHNDVFGEEIMLEAVTEDEDGFALVTKPVAASAANDFVCNSWQLSGDTFVPSEFSDRSVVESPTFEVVEHKTTFNRLAAVLHEYGAESVLGPCLNYSEEVLARRPQEDAKLLERIDSDNRANIVRFALADDPALRTSVKTKWKATRAVDETGKNSWAAACSCTCYAFPETGKHSGTHAHIK